MARSDNNSAPPRLWRFLKIERFFGRLCCQARPRLIGIFDEVQAPLFERQDQIIGHLRAAPFVRQVGVELLKRDEPAARPLADQNR